MSTWVTQIRELGELREAGLLTEEEFVEQKALVLPSKTSTPEGPSLGVTDEQSTGQVPTRKDQAPVKPAAPTVALGTHCPTCNQLVTAGEGAYGWYELGGQWRCFQHREPWCLACARSERLTRGEFDASERSWVCFEHGIESCNECWTLLGERPF